MTSGAEHEEAASARRGGWPGGRGGTRLAWLEAALAVAAYAVLCVLVLRVTPRLVEPDDAAYRALIVAMTQGHFLTLSGAQAEALAQALGGPAAHGFAGGRILGGPGVIPQWVQLGDGQWISGEGPRLSVPGRPLPGHGHHPVGATEASSRRAPGRCWPGS